MFSRALDFIRKTLHWSTRISLRVLFGGFCLIAVGLLIGGHLFYRSQAEAIREQKSNELESIAKLKVNQILQWRQERLTDATMNSSSPFFAQRVKNWIQSPDDSTLRAELLNHFQMIVDHEGYQSVILASQSGQILLSYDPVSSAARPVSSDLVNQAVQANAPVFGDLTYDENSKTVYLDVAAPIRDGDVDASAILILRIDPEQYLFPLIQSWPVPSQSAETLLTKKDGSDALFLNTLRFRDDPPMTFRVPLTNTNIPAVQAGLGRTGEFQGVDYRGEEVLAGIYPIPGTSWTIIAKVDLSEILAEVHSLGLAVTLIVALAILMTALLATYAFHFRQKVLFQNLYNAERELRKSQEETRTTLYSIGDGVITTDAHGLVTRINPVAEQLTGWIEAQAVGQPLPRIFNVINEVTREPVENPAERALRDGITVGLANHSLLIARDGTERPIADSAAPIRNALNDITGVVLVFRDQTKEKALQREHALLNYTIATSLNEIYLFDADTLKFRFVNEGALKNLGYSLDQMRDMTPLDIKPELTAEQFHRLIQPLLNHEESALYFETVHKRIDGSLYPVEVHLQLFEYEKERVFLAVINDISERTRSRMELEENKARLEQAQKIAHIGNWEIDLDENKIWASDEAFRIYGLEQGDSFISLEKARAIPIPEDRQRLAAALDDLIHRNGTYDIEFRIRRENDGAERIVHSTAYLERDKAGFPRKVVGILRDITETKAAEQALRESEDRYRRLFQNDHVVMLIVDPENGQIVDANPAACEFYGWTREELLQRKVSDLNTLAENEILEAMALVKKEQRGVFTFQHRRNNLPIADVEVFSGPIQLHGKKLLFSIVHDITERKKVEKKVDEQLQELRRWHKAMLGRETRILELKREVNDLLIQLNQPPRYGSD